MGDVLTFYNVEEEGQQKQTNKQTNKRTNKQTNKQMERWVRCNVIEDEEQEEKVGW